MLISCLWGAAAGDGSGLLYLRTPHYFSHEEIKLLGGPGCCGLHASPPPGEPGGSEAGGSGSEAGGSGAVPCARHGPRRPGSFPSQRCRKAPSPGSWPPWKGPRADHPRRGRGRAGGRPRDRTPVSDAKEGCRPLTTAPGSWVAGAAHSPALMLVPRAHRRPGAVARGLGLGVAKPRGGGARRRAGGRPAARALASSCGRRGR